MCRSDPQIAVVVTLMMASRGLSRTGSGTVSTRICSFPSQQTARITAPCLGPEARGFPSDGAGCAPRGALDAPSASCRLPHGGPHSHVQRGSAFAFRLDVFETVQLSWSQLARRTWREGIDDDVLGLAAQLAYYFFLAL